jgi:hypothetical protein
LKKKKGCSKKEAIYKFIPLKNIFNDKEVC